MIEKSRLYQLKPGQKRRKIVLTLESIERRISAVPPLSDEDFERREYLRILAGLVANDEKTTSDEKAALNEAMSDCDFDERRVCNIARNALLRILGMTSAEWNLVVAPHDKNPDLRKSFSGVQIFAEDIRSPFNLGSIFRTAEAFGAEKIWLSPLCCDERHPRAVRSAMGATEILPSERLPLDNLPSDLPVFVLETGGTPIGDFQFPKRGIAIIGSEELGASPAAIRKATAGIVSIPLPGSKASLNVSVAFGIMMSRWAERYLQEEK